MFSLREFLMKGFKDAIGKMADYQVILNATGYYEKNVLTTEDLAELQSLIDQKNTPPAVGSDEISEELPGSAEGETSESGETMDGSAENETAESPADAATETSEETFAEGSEENADN